MSLVVLTLAFALAQAQNIEALNNQAQQLAQAQQFEKAERLWKQALAQSPLFFPAAFNLGYMNFFQKRFAKAEPFLRQAAKIRPDDFNSHYLLGIVQRELGQRDTALRAWRTALALQPNNVKLMQIMAVEYGLGGYFSDAAAVAKRALALSNNDQNAYFIALKAVQDAHDPAGLKIAQEAVTKFPESPRANFEFGFHLQKAGQHDDSLRYLRRAMELDPRYEEPFYFFGGLMLDEGRLDEAIPALKKALENKPDYTSASVALARALMEKKQESQAVTVLEEAIRLSPKHPQPHLMLSRLYFRMGDQERAAQEKNLSLSLRRENASLMERPQGRPFQ